MLPLYITITGFSGTGKTAVAKAGRVATGLGGYRRWGEIQEA